MSQRIFVREIRKYLELNNEITTYKACGMQVKHSQRVYLAKKED